MQCLNLSNKEVKAAVDEVARVLGSEDAAYYIISENNGHAVDKAPDGEPSQLFSDILQANNDNRDDAIKEMADLIAQGLKTANQSGPSSWYSYQSLDTFLERDSDGNTVRSISSGELVSKLLPYLPPNSAVSNIAKLLVNTNTEVFIYNPSVRDYMSYNAGNDIIYINQNEFNKNRIGYNAESLAHEIVHAYTARTILRIENVTANEAETKLYDSLNKMYEHYNKHFKDKKTEKGFTGRYYGLNNIHDFTAELLTNRSFIRLLQSAPEAKVNESFINKLKNFIVNLLESLGLIETETDLQRLQNDLLDLLTYNIQNDIKEQDFIDDANDLLQKESQSAENIEEILKYTEQDKEELSEILHNISTVILEGLQSRKKVYNDPDPSVRAKVRSQMEWQIQNISQGLTTDLENIVNFLNDIQDEVKSTTQFLIDARKNDILINDTKLNDLDQNFFQFYCGAVDEIVKQLIYREPYREIVGTDKAGNYKLDRIIQRAKTYQNLLTEGHTLVKVKMAENASKILNDVGVQVGAPVIYNYSKSNPSTSQKDISVLTYGMGAGDKIKDSHIKTIFYLINSAEDKTNHDVFTLTQKFNDILKKIKGRDQMKLFELDDDGNTTGYLVRARNYGKFEQNYQKAMQDICFQLGLDVTEIGLPENRSIRIKYNTLRNEWLSKHTERRFTKDYYDAFNHLSEEARSQRESVQLNIRTLLSKTRDEYGIARLERLTPEERETLKQYELDKKQLSSIYDYKGRMKQGIQLQVAQELTELNKKLQEGFTMTKNSAAFETEKARVMANKDLTKAQKQEWLDLNSKVQFKEEFYNQLEKLEKKYYGPKYAELQERRRALLRMFRDDATGEVLVDLMPVGTKNAIQLITREMNRIRKTKQASIIAGDNAFEEIAEVVPTSKWYKDKRMYYDSVIAENPEAAELWLQENAYNIRETLPNGKVTVKLQPKPWYTKMQPRDKSMIETVPNNNWLEVSKDSKFYNKAYYEAQEKYPELQNEYWIPKDKVRDDKGKVVDSYDNTGRYNAIKNNANLSELYDLITATLEESNSELTNLNKTYPYRIPQKSGSLYKYMKAGWNRGEGLDRLYRSFAGFMEWMKDALSSKNDDVGFNKELTKPNGERLNLIPQNFIKRLDDPAVISADLVKGVIEFYKSSKNWKYKSEIQPQIEILKNNIKGKKFRNGATGEVKEGESNTYKFAKAFVDMNLYGIRQKTLTMTYGDNKSGKLLGIIPYKGNIFNLVDYDISKPREFNLTKMLAILKVLGTTRNLALNVVCALTGGITAMNSHIVNSLTQRYYNPVDAFYALKDMLVDLVINVPAKIGITTYKPKMTQYMEYFEVGAEAMPNPTNRFAIVNMVSKHWGFGIYTMQDHFIKGQILGAIMNNYKLIEDANGNKRFINREQYKKENNLDMYTPGDYYDWNFGDKPTFKDCTEFVAGKLVAVDPKNQKAVDAVVEEIGYLARTLAQSADGQLTNLQKPVLLAHAFGQFVMMHRQYLPVIIQERYTMSRQYDYQTKRWKEGVFRTPVRLIEDAIAHNESIIKAYKRLSKEDPTVRENLAKLFYETTLWLMLAKIIRPLCSGSADDDKRNIIKQILAYAIERSSFEVIAPYNVVDMLRVIKSPTAITSYVENMFELFQQPVGIMYESTKAMLKGEDYRTKRIRRGAYKNWTEGERAAMKLTPFKNLIELQDIQSKRNYYKKQILGE